MAAFQFNLNGTNAPQLLIATPTQFRSASFFAISGFTASGTPISNAATIYLGTNSGKMPIVTSAGAAFNLNQATIQEKDNLGQYYAMGKIGDGFYIIYQ